MARQYQVLELGASAGLAYRAAERAAMVSVYVSGLSEWLDRRQASGVPAIPKVAAITVGRSRPIDAIL